MPIKDRQYKDITEKMVIFEEEVLIQKLMKKTILLLSVVLSLVALCLVVGCHPKEPNGEEVVGSSEEVVGQQEEPSQIDQVDIDYSSPYEGDIDIVGAAAPGFEEDLEKYTVDLYVAPDMKKDIDYIMKVNVFLPKYETEPVEGMIRGSKTIYAGAVNYVRVIPVAPGFDVDPAESATVDFDPSGTDFQFTIIPRETGPRTISAEVWLLENRDGSGDIKSKASGTVSVVVKVDTIHNILGGLKELWEVVWKAFKDFWGVAVALVFAALLFMFRIFIKKKTGYGSTQDQSDEPEQSEEQDE